MTDSGEKRRKARREALAGLSLFAFLAISMGSGAIYGFRYLPAHLGIDVDHSPSGWEAFWIVAIVIVVMVFLLYVGVVAWLLFARLFFSKAEVSRVAFHGAHTRFDRWLVDTAFRNQP